MIFRNIYQLIYIHPIIYIFIILSFITGTLTQLFILLLIVFIHELGHFIVANYFRWNIEKITIWVFGAVMETSEYRVRRIHEDLLVTIAGPMQHILIFLVLYSLQFVNFVPSTMIDLCLTYNFVLLMFNLLPIYPLDGGKILFYILAYFYPYRLARRFVILLSLWSCILIICLQIIYLPFTLTAMILMIFLFIENRAEWKQQHYHFMRYLMARFYFPKVDGKSILLRRNLDDSLIDTLKKFYLYKKHIIMIEYGRNTIEYSEQTCLSLFFLRQKVTQTFKSIMMEKN